MFVEELPTVSTNQLGIVSRRSENKYPLRDIIWPDVKKRAKESINEFGESYCQPIYLIPIAPKDEMTSEVSHRKFWSNNNKHFLFLTRIHARDDLERRDGENTTLLEEIRAVYEDFPNDDYICGKTLELSDLLLITRANSIGELLERVEKLSARPKVGDVYSYCCISRTLFETGRFPGDDRIAQINNDRIPMVSMRMAIRDTSLMESLLDDWCRKLKEKGYSNFSAYFVTGTEDVNIIFIDISTRLLLFFLQYALVDQGDWLWKAVEDITTRLGTHISEVPRKETLLFTHTPNQSIGSISPQNTLRSAYAKIQMTLQSIDDPDSGDWMPTLCRIVNALTNLSDDCVLDQVGYILLDGLTGLIAKLKTHRKEWNNFSDDLYKITDGIVYLEDHILRTESQLVAHPEMRPLVFSIPANILELSLMFISEYSNYLQSGDQEKNTFHFLIVPRLCKVITIRNMIHNEGEKDYLLYVEIPLATCYRPEFVTCVLAHETAHFSGECTRLRSCRASAMFSATAVMLSHLLEMGESEKCQLFLKKRLIDLHKAGAFRSIYMDDLLNGMSESTQLIIQDQKFIEELAYEYSRETGNRHHIARLMDLHQHILNKGEIQKVICATGELGMLARECYADLAMIHLLNIDAQTYFNIVWDCYYTNNMYDDDQLCRMIVIERIALVFLVAYNDIDWKLSSNAMLKDAKKIQKVRQLWSAVEIYCQEFFGGRNMAVVCAAEATGVNLENEDCYFHPFEAVDHLFRYLTKCLEEMRKNENNNVSQMEKIRSLYSIIQGDQFLDCEEFPDLLQHRNGLLN